jgi:HEAT repeat protein
LVPKLAGKPEAPVDAAVTEAADRRRAVVIAGHAGDVDTALTGLGDEDEHVRASALGALQRLGRLSTAELEEALADPTVTVRRRAAELAATHPDVDLSVALADADASVIEIAAWATGEQGRKGAATIDRLAALALRHDDALVREAAVAALGALGDEAGLPAILEATGDRATVRRRAVIALAPFDGPEVDAALERARQDRDWQVRQAAEDLLGR